MEDVSLATLVAKLEVQHQYTKDALNQINNSIKEFFDESRKDRQDIHLELAEVKSELAIARKIGNVALGLAITMGGGLGLAILKLVLHI